MSDSNPFEPWQTDQPWDEYEWEAFLCEQDGLTERYMELEAKHRGEPDADERIAREMGWTLPIGYGSEESPYGDGSSDDEAALDEVFGDSEASSYEEDPLWQRAHAVALAFQDVLPMEEEGLVACGAAEALTHTAMLAAKIAGGHSMGFSRDALGGNIANHKRAMSHMLHSLSALDETEAARVVTAKEAARLRIDLLHVRERLMDRIVELRRMFTRGQFIDD